MLEDGVWRTVNGSRIYIKRGQSINEAIRDRVTRAEILEADEVQLDDQEYAIVQHSVNTYYSRFKGMKICLIRLFSYQQDQDFDYLFINNGFSKYKVIAKMSVDEDFDE